MTLDEQLSYVRRVLQARTHIGSGEAHATARARLRIVWDAIFDGRLERFHIEFLEDAENA